MSQTQKFDPSIPVLTEVLWGAREETGSGQNEPDAAGPGAPPPAALQVHEAYQTPAQDLPAREVTQDLQDQAQQWDALEQRLTARILHQVQESLDSVVARCVADVLQGALQHLSGELHTGLRDTVEKVVAQAVSEERKRFDPQR